MPDEWGVESSYEDADGATRAVPDRTVARLRDIIGRPREDGPLIVQAGRPAPTGPGEIVLEDGTPISVDATADSAPTDLPLGYHAFVDPEGRSRRLIVTPPRCHLPAGWRAWGWAAQVYATRSSRSWGMGDLGDLAGVAAWSRAHGGGFVLVNPLGAVAPAGPQQPSPYFPASRRFQNPLYLRVEDVPGAELVPEVVEGAAAAGRSLNQYREIDRDAVWRIKLEALEAIWRTAGAGAAFDRWYDEQPLSLRRFATWAVLTERHGPRWRDWPTDLHDPHASAVAAAAAESGDRVRFHAWLQWLVDRQLGAVARDLPVVQDLPIGFDPDGFDAWEWQDLLALDVSVGAPPDEFNRQGQYWGLPPFVPWKLRAAGYQPFVETIRASMAAGGGLRVDHVMGLFRLWWIAAGESPADGAYVRYPAEDLLALMALESQRSGAVVVGEDLGTVEEGVRPMLAERDILSYRLLWFEEDDPSTWPPTSMAAVTTHDLPTVAGLWDGSDLQTQRRLGLNPNERSTAAIQARLAATGPLAPDATGAEAVVAAYQLLARAPSVMLTATLEDAAVEAERPNIPGADDLRPNWSLALPVTLDELRTSPTAARIGDVLTEATRGPADATSHSTVTH
ncbi:4-alpha-glucanotransferase [Actinopolymorpha pittospori]|uniref:4-alpha-glucanotransferase n=1 Tax=Actinopolymorpha pittospori TaxID=648752 RepID=A0A927RIB9_9ACTN|nr:4-alpha-glucanotransferase [Actinopolymorpha pittospori]MBE1613125.1 4-alpha-glucanotransferase [Actinopolymorpha pittospori]